MGPCTPQHSSSGWGHCPLADAGSFSGTLHSDWPSAHPGSPGQLSEALYSHWLLGEPFSASFSGIFWGEARREELLMGRSWHGGRLGITSMHRGSTGFGLSTTRFHGGITGAHRITLNLYRGITGLHKGVTVIHSSAAGWRWRRVWNPMHAALIKGVGHNNNNNNNNCKRRVNYLCYSRFYGKVLFLFIFCSAFSVFSLYTFLFYFLLSLINFSFRWDFVLVRVKHVVRFYKIFIIKSRGRGVHAMGKVITKKNEQNTSRQAEFTTSPGRSDTGRAVFQWVLNYDWARAWMIWKR